MRVLALIAVLLAITGLVTNSRRKEMSASVGVSTEHWLIFAGLGLAPFSLLLWLYAESRQFTVPIFRNGAALVLGVFWLSVCVVPLAFLDSARRGSAIGWIALFIGLAGFFSLSGASTAFAANAAIFAVASIIAGTRRERS